MSCLRFPAGLLMIPLCVAATRTVLDLVQALQAPLGARLPPAALALVAGFLLWLLVYFTLPRPVRTYILAHELTHALWASLMGADVTDLRVGRSGGSVTLSKSNFLIILAPYFFPLYTVLVIGLYYLLGIFFNVERYGSFWLALVGFSWGFHFTFTVTTLLQRQSDIQSCGRLFSYTVIYTLNLLGIGIWIVMVSPATLEQLIGLLVTHTEAVVLACGQMLGTLVRKAGLQ